MHGNGVITYAYIKKTCVRGALSTLWTFISSSRHADCFPSCIFSFIFYFSLFFDTRTSRHTVIGSRSWPPFGITVLVGFNKPAPAIVPSRSGLTSDRHACRRGDLNHRGTLSGIVQAFSTCTVHYATVPVISHSITSIQSRNDPARAQSRRRSRSFIL